MSSGPTRSWSGCSTAADKTVLTLAEAATVLITTRTRS